MMLKRHLNEENPLSTKRQCCSHEFVYRFLIGVHLKPIRIFYIDYGKYFFWKCSIKEEITGFFFSISQLSLIKNATLCWIERFKINLLLFHVNPCGPIGKNQAFEKKQDSLGLHDKGKVSLQTINIIAPCITALNLCCLDRFKNSNHCKNYSILMHSGRTISMKYSMNLTHI